MTAARSILTSLGLVLGLACLAGCQTGQSGQAGQAGQTGPGTPAGTAGTPAKGTRFPEHGALISAACAPDGPGEICDTVARDLTQSEWQQFAPETPYTRTCGR
ncbi:hypothetical protein [Bailinhaonella thermotolerans]|nr:hypothetical protein [Bailinhaonella thermotolerans]